MKIEQKNQLSCGCVPRRHRRYPPGDAVNCEAYLGGRGQTRVGVVRTMTMVKEPTTASIGVLEVERRQGRAKAHWTGLSIPPVDYDHGDVTIT